jgi:bifunctional ADP-heptose synthase (sugar kinase/adenylyltransferase)
MMRITSKKRAYTIIENFSSSGVLVVGDIMADHFIRGGVSRISPEAPVPAVEVASHAAGIVARKVGAATETREELKKVI